MSLNYNVTSPAVINGTGTSQCSLDMGGDSINIQTPSGLSNIYNFVLPPDIGIQDQVLTLNSSLETDWVNFVEAVQSYSVLDNTSFSSTSTSFVLVPSMILTPPAGTYYVIFNSYGSALIEYAIFVGGSILNETVRQIDTNNEEDLTSIAVVTVNGSDDIDVRARSTNGSTMDIFERKLLIYSVFN